MTYVFLLPVLMSLLLKLATMKTHQWYPSKIPYATTFRLWRTRSSRCCQPLVSPPSGHGCVKWSYTQVLSRPSSWLRESHIRFYWWGPWPWAPHKRINTSIKNIPVHRRGILHYKHKHYQNQYKVTQSFKVCLAPLQGMVVPPFQ